MTVRVRAAWELYQQGLPPRRIAKILGATPMAVYSRLRWARAELGVTPAGVAEKAAADLPRCHRCKLLLPCNGCLPRAAEVATRRVA